MAQAIDSLYVTLGLDITEFERDFASADKSFQKAARKLESSVRMTKLRMEVDMAGFDAADKSVAALNARLSGLNKVYNEQYKLVAVTNTAWQQAVKKYGETSYQSQKLEARYLKEQKALKYLEQQMKQTATVRADVKSGFFQEILSFAGIGSAAAITATAIGVATSLAMVGKASIKMAIDADIAEKKFMASLGSSATIARRWSNEISSSFGLNPIETRKGLATFFSMISNLGVTRDKALEMSEALVQLSYDLSTMNGIPIQEVFERLQAGLRGEMDPMEKLNIFLKENDIASYAAANGIAKFGEQLTSTQKTLAVYAGMLDQTKTAQGALADEQNSPSAMLKRLQVHVDELEVKIGKKLLPAYSKLLEVTLGLLGENVNPSNNNLLNVINGTVMGTIPAVSFLIDLFKQLNDTGSESPKGQDNFNYYLDKAISKAERAKELAAELDPNGTNKYINDEINKQVEFEYDQGAVRKANRQAIYDKENQAKTQLRIDAEKNEKIKQDTIKLNDEVNAINESALAVELTQIQRKVEEYRKAGLAEVDIAKFITTKETEARRVQLEAQRRTITEIYGTELDKRLIQIEEAKQSYIKAGFDEAKAREMVEKQKLKTIKDYSKQAGDAIRSALMGGWGDVVNAVKDALDAGENGYAAMEKALRLNERNLKNQTQAADMVAERLGMTRLERQMITPQTPMQQLNQARTDVFGQSYTDSLNRFVQQLEIVGNSITSKWVEAPNNQPRNVNLNVTVDVQGASMDDMQTADRIAAIITPQVERAISGNNYGY